MSQAAQDEERLGFVRGLLEVQETRMLHMCTALRSEHVRRTEDLQLMLCGEGRGGDGFLFGLLGCY